MKTELLTLLARENPLFSNRVHIPQAVDQMCLGNAENKKVFPPPLLPGNHQMEQKRRGTDP